MPLPSPLPDSPNRWDGWRNYNSDNPYERLCLDFEANPSGEQIEENCRQLLVWWQKKLPLKSQPSNPATQLLRQGLDDAPKFLAEARNILLNADSRRNADERLRARLKENAAAEFYKFLSFALADGLLKRDDETNLYHLGGAAGLDMEEMRLMVESELSHRGAKRFVPPPPPAAASVTRTPFNPQEGVVFEPVANATAPPRLNPGAPSNDPRTEFARLIRLSGLNEDDMTDDQRDALCNMGENLGLTGGEAEDAIDAYLEEVSGLSPDPRSNVATAPVRRAPAAQPPPAPVVKKPSEQHQTPRILEAMHAERFSPLSRDLERQKHPRFTSSIGAEMLFIPSGTIMMGSNAEGAAPNEQPLSKTNISCFYISRFPITNALFEQFDAAHRSKRPGWADENHPAVYVSSVEAIKFCEWLSRHDGKKYRLPTEAEWEYAARGTDGRTFPWGEKLNRGDLANFADCNTTFPWRDAEINDGFAETAPVGKFPRGASPFGAEDMAGNVWEWCLDFYEPYKGKERTNPRSGLTVGRRIYRGGSWKSRASSLRTTTRNFNIPEYSANDVGFRIVCECQ
ncbi:MAG: formylglycine-generating enzyme family protein [Chthoniobacteraceae bacterium]|jgi:formylglycine-generating enzyme required for sulfatase activity